MAGCISWLIIALVVCAFWLLVLWDKRNHPHVDRSSATATRQRLLKPRTPDDCPGCRQRALRSSTSPSPPPVRPWKDIKSRRGPPKRITTDGFACPNSACTYFRIIDAMVHALVGDGRHGKHEHIQTFR